MGLASRQVVGSRGMFVVSVDGKSIFDKARTGRYPDPGEIVALLRAGV